MLFLLSLKLLHPIPVNLNTSKATLLITIRNRITLLIFLALRLIMTFLTPVARKAPLPILSGLLPSY